MSLLLVALLQAIQATPPERIALTVKQPCEARKGAPDEIVVCGRNSNPHRYRLSERLPEQQTDISKAELQLMEGVKAAVETEAAGVGGHESGRLMVRLKIKF